MSLTTDQLYKLLPAIYRIRDAQQGEPLKALIAVIAEQAGLMEADIARLSDNWFIETCDEWVIPYIGDLLGVRGLHTIDTATVFSQRAHIANTLRYRRRKGTATMLEQLAFDTTGWRARAVEFFELLGTTQHSNHIRLHNQCTPDLRRANMLELLDTAFDKIAHTVDVRRIAIGRGWHNIPNIGLFLWRLQSYPVIRSTARAVSTPADGRYTFNPLGYDEHLFNKPQTETEITHLAEEINVPGMLRRRPLYDELEARRQALVDSRTPDYVYFDDRMDAQAQPVLEVFINGSLVPVSPDEMVICDLQNWHIPADQKTYELVQADGTIVMVDRPITVAVDPVLGRLTFPATVPVNAVQVSYAYGFSGDVGGGPYNRRSSVAEALSRKVTWQVGVSKEVTAVPGQIFSTLSEAVAEWNLQPGGTVGVITILDSYTYEEDLTGNHQIQIPEGSQLLMVAADWPEVDVPGGLPGEKHRVLGQVEPDERRPHVRGNISVAGTAPLTSLTAGELVLDGLLVEGKLSVLAGNLGTLRVAHCTLVPDQGGLEVDTQNEQLKINLFRSICGPIELESAVSKLYLEDSIIDWAGGTAIKAIETAVMLQRCTVFGSMEVLSIEAGNCIFTDKLVAERRQVGCVRFSFVPFESETPRRFRCQPDLEITTQISEAEEQAALSEVDQNLIRERILGWLVPNFTAENYGLPGYGQLRITSPVQIRTGAEDGSEMGAFSFLKQPQRETNLRIRLDEYLPFGLEAGVIYVT